MVFFLNKSVYNACFFSTFDTTWMKNVDVSEEAEYHIQDAFLPCHMNVRPMR